MKRLMFLLALTSALTAVSGTQAKAYSTAGVPQDLWAQAKAANDHCIALHNITEKARTAASAALWKNAALNKAYYTAKTNEDTALRTARAIALKISNIQHGLPNNSGLYDDVNK